MRGHFLGWLSGLLYEGVWLEVIVIIVCQLVYNLFRGRKQPTYIGVIFKPFPKYHGHLRIYLVGGWTTRLKNMDSQIGFIFPNFRGEHIKKNV